MKNKWVRLMILALLFSCINNLFQMQYAVYTQNQTLEEELGTAQTDSEQVEENTEKTEEIKPIKYKLSLKQVINNEEVWKTYTVDVTEAREEYGIYWLNNSKTPSYQIKIKFNENGTVDVSEYDELGIKVRHLAKLQGGSIVIDTYDKIDTQAESKEQDNKNKTEETGKEAIENE